MILIRYYGKLMIDLDIVSRDVLIIVASYVFDS